MHSLALLLAVSMTRMLDPYTELFQTDDEYEGRALAAKPGFWLSANGQKDPLAKKPEARIMYNVFYTSDEQPILNCDPPKPSPLFKVNQVGYSPDQPKYAYLGAWLGPKLGAWKPKWREEGRGKREEVVRGRDLPSSRTRSFLPRGRRSRTCSPPIAC